MRKILLICPMMMLLTGCATKQVDPLIFELEHYSFSDKEAARIKETQCLDKDTLDRLLINKRAIDARLGL